MEPGLNFNMTAFPSRRDSERLKRHQSPTNRFRNGTGQDRTGCPLQGSDRLMDTEVQGHTDLGVVDVVEKTHSVPSGI